MTGRSTCFAMYNGTASGLAAEDYSFIDKTMERPTQRTLYYHDLFPQGMKKYLLRPETVESLYVMYAKTKNPVFREWGWQIWSTIKEKCKSTYGYAFYSGVYLEKGVLEDRVETWFYSETMKYLYLLFAESGDEYVKDYVFNTEAHPIPRN